MTDLLTMWLEARAHDWQPLTARDHRSRVRFITEDLGTVRLVDLDPLRVDAWLAQMRRRGVGQGAIRGRLSTFKAACSWGVSRRLLRSNPVAASSMATVASSRMTPCPTSSRGTQRSSNPPQATATSARGQTSQTPCRLAQTCPYPVG